VSLVMGSFLQCARHTRAMVAKGVLLVIPAKAGIQRL
jgi:hypothetical protein